MAVLPIIKVPDPVLSEKTRKISDFGEETHKIIRNLKDTLDVASDPEGAGISANQVGISKSICVVRNFLPIQEGEATQEGDEESIFDELVLINPKIVSLADETDIDWEGCLSVPNVYGKVPRSIKIKFKYKDENGAPKRLVAKGFFARIIQHEIDHLNGILFTQKVVGKTVPGEYFSK